MMLIALNSPPNMVALAALILRMHFVTFANPRQMHAILCAALCYAGLGLTAPGLTGLILRVVAAAGVGHPGCGLNSERHTPRWHHLHLLGDLGVNLALFLTMRSVVTTSF